MIWRKNERKELEIIKKSNIFATTNPTTLLAHKASATGWDFVFYDNILKYPLHLMEN